MKFFDRFVIFICLWLLVTQFHIIPNGRFLFSSLGIILFSFYYIIISQGKFKFNNYLQRNWLLLNFSFFFITLLFSPLSSLDASIVEFIYGNSKLFICFFSTVFGAYAFKNLRVSQFSVKVLSCISIIYLSFELFFRLNSFSGINAIISLLSGNFYVLKVDSIMFHDTNSLAIYGFLLFIIVSCFNDVSPKKSNKLVLMALTVFIIFTLSRAAILSLFLFLTYIFLSKRSSSFKLAVYSFGAVVFVILCMYLYPLVVSDASGNTKIKVFSSIPVVFESLSSLEKMFGVGLVDGPWLYSYEEGAFAHAIIPMVLGTFGAVGLIFYILYFVMLFVLSNSAYLRGAILSIWVLGLSFYPPFYEMTFFSLGAVYSMWLVNNENSNYFKQK